MKKEQAINWEDLLCVAQTMTPEQRQAKVIVRITGQDTDEEYPITNIDESKFILEAQCQTC